MKILTRILSFTLLIMLGNWATAQTTLIDPTTVGGFESGASFAANGWTEVNGAQTNKWQVDVGATPGFTGANAAYVSNSVAATFAHTYTITASSVVHFYRDVTVPAGETDIRLMFDWIGVGETTFDRMRVYLVPTTFTPVAGTQITTTGTAPTGRVLVGLANYSGQASWTSTGIIVVPAAYAGTTFRIVFQWRNDGTIGTQPPAGIDNISLTSQLPPACPFPTANAATLVTGNSAQANWNLNTGTFIVEYGPTATFLPVGTAGTAGNANNSVVSVTNANLAALAGLTPATGYSYVVRQDCTGAGNGYSINSNTINFTTNAAPPDCATGTVLACNTDQANVTPAGTGAWNPIATSCGFATPGLERVYRFTPTFTGTHTLVVTAGGTGFYDYFFKLASDGCSSTGWTCIDDIGSGGTTGVNFGPLTAGLEYYILLDKETTAAGSATFRINCPSLCPFPTASAATLVTTTTAQANWNLAVGTFIVEYGPTATFAPVGTGATAGNANNTIVTVVDANSAALAGLTPATGYSYVVRQDCTGAGNGYSANSNTITFTTAAPPPANDVCADAIDITVSGVPVAGTNAGSTDENVIDGTCDVGASPDVWYKFTTVLAGDVTATLDGTPGSLDAVLTAYSSCLTADEIDCIDGPLAGDIEILNLTGLAAGTEYYLRASGFSGDQGAFTISISGSALPLELKSFTGKVEGSVNVLSWETLTEKNVQSHIVDRSIDGTRWSEVGRVASKGDSQVAVKYSLEDRAPLAKAYYRLRSVDFDGKESRSNTILLTRKSEQFGITNVYPSPTSNNVTVQFNATAEEEVTVRVMDMQGRLVMQQITDAVKDINELPIVLTGLQAGVYSVTVSNSIGTSVPVRFVKQ